MIHFFTRSVFLRIFIQKIFKIGVYKKNGHRKKWVEMRFFYKHMPKYTIPPILKNFFEKNKYGVSSEFDQKTHF